MRNWLFLFLRPLGEGFFRLVLLLVVGVVVAILFGFGDFLGVPDVFWDHESWVLQIEAGIGVGLLLFQVCFIAFLIDEDNASDNDALPPPWPWGLARYLLVTLAPLLIFLLVPAVIFCEREWPWMPVDKNGPAVFLMTRWPFIGGLMASVLAACGVSWLFHSFRDKAVDMAEALVARAPSRKIQWIIHGVIAVVFGVILLPPWSGFSTLAWCFVANWWPAAHGGFLSLCRIPSERDKAWKHLLAGMAFGAFFLIYEIVFVVYWLEGAGLDPGARWISPALVLCLIFALLVHPLGFLRYQFQYWYLAWLFGVAAIPIVAGLCFSDPFPLRFPGMTHRADPERPAASYYAAPVSLLDADFQRTLTEVEQKKKPDGTPLKEEDKTAELQKSYAFLRDRYRSEQRRFPTLALEVPDMPETRNEMKDWAGRIRFELLEQEKRRRKNWKTNLKEEKPKLVVVCVSGGAARSGYWTSLVLDALEKEEQLKGFPAHVRIITGASGGMFGAAHWTATLGENGHDAENVFRPEATAADVLTPVTQTMLFADMPTWLVPHERTWDRGQALEAAWKRNCPEFGQSFRDSLAPGEDAGWRPSLIFSPMLVEDGRRLLISNLYLPFLAENEGDLLPEQQVEEEAAAPSSEPKPPKRPRGRIKGENSRYSVQAMEFFHLFPEANDFQLGTAVRMNASFPYVSPATDLPTEPRRRVVDAGYYDDYGVDLATGWIAYNRHWILRNTSGIVLIQMRDEASANRVQITNEDQGSWRALEWLTGPLAGVASARTSVMSFRNDERVQALDHFFNEDHERSAMFTTVVFGCDEKIEMTWRLTAEDQKRMRDSLQSPTNQQGFRALTKWWKEPHKAGSAP